jgi:arginyl-tRNA synthetase
MSSRKGNIIELQQLITVATQIAKTRLEQNIENGKSSVSPTEIDKVAHQVGVGASVYLDLKASRTRGINITELEKEVDFDGNTAAYLQYTCARGFSIDRQAMELGITPDPEAPMVLETEVENSIVKQLAMYPEAIAQAVEVNEPARIAEYAYALASLFNSFYHEHSVLKEPDEAKRNSRLRLTEAVTQTIHNALALIMIETPAKM